MRVPAIVGAYPEPFRSGIQGKRRPVRVECEDADAEPCRDAKAALESSGVPVSGASLGAPGTETVTRLVVARWPRARIVRGAPSLEEGPEASGVFARLDRAGPLAGAARRERRCGAHRSPGRRHGPRGGASTRGRGAGVAGDRPGRGRRSRPAWRRWRRSGCRTPSPWPSPVLPWRSFPSRHEPRPRHTATGPAPCTPRGPARPPPSAARLPSPARSTATRSCSRVSWAAWWPPGWRPEWGGRWSARCGWRCPSRCCWRSSTPSSTRRAPRCSCAAASSSDAAGTSRSSRRPTAPSTGCASSC